MQDLHQQLDDAESQIRQEQQKRNEAEEAVGNMRDQLAGVKSALGSQVIELDGQLKTSQQQCSQLQIQKVIHEFITYMSYIENSKKGVTSRGLFTSQNHSS